MGRLRFESSLFANEQQVVNAFRAPTNPYTLHTYVSMTDVAPAEPVRFTKGRGRHPDAVCFRQGPAMAQDIAAGVRLNPSRIERDHSAPALAAGDSDQRYEDATLVTRGSFYFPRDGDRFTSSSQIVYVNGTACDMTVRLLLRGEDEHVLGEWQLDGSALVLLREEANQADLGVWALDGNVRRLGKPEIAEGSYGRRTSSGAILR
jgi:hypothetical protein